MVIIYSCFILNWLYLVDGEESFAWYLIMNLPHIILINADSQPYIYFS